jgi:hypothetical protein
MKKQADLKSDVQVIPLKAIVFKRLVSADFSVSVSFEKFISYFCRAIKSFPF